MFRIFYKFIFKYLSLIFSNFELKLSGSESINKELIVTFLLLEHDYTIEELRLISEFHKATLYIGYLI